MIDSYSAFFDNTGIKGSGSTGLREMVEGSTEIVVVGLAMDYCVGGGRPSLVFTLVPS